MRSVLCTLAALAAITLTSVASASIESDVSIQSNCSSPKVTTAVTTQAVLPPTLVPQTTVKAYSVPATFVETPAQQLTLTIPGERYEIPARTVEVHTQQATVATQAVCPTYTATSVAATSVQTNVDVGVEKTVWRKDRLRTLMANRQSEAKRLTTQSVQTVTTQTSVDTECKRKRLRDRHALTQLDGIELD